MFVGCFREVMVVAVKNIRGFVEVGKDGDWVCVGDKKHKPESFSDPVRFPFLFWVCFSVFVMEKLNMRVRERDHGFVFVGLGGEEAS